MPAKNTYGLTRNGMKRGSEGREMEILVNPTKLTLVRDDIPSFKRKPMIIIIWICEIAMEIISLG
jgi:hypothetical protein